MDDKKLEQLINMLVKERNELKGEKKSKEDNQFEKGLAFFMEVWNLMVEYSKYFDKLEETITIEYLHTTIRTQRNNKFKYSLEMKKDYFNFMYNISEETNLKELFKLGYNRNSEMMLFLLKEFMEQPLEFYEEQIYKQLTDAIVKYNRINKDFKELIGKAD